jgi:23S rRNA (adenine2503-C2)-methyltransferase
VTAPLDLAAGTVDDLAAGLKAMGEPAFRAKQIRRHLFERGVRDVAEMTDLPAALRARLVSEATIGTTSVAAEQKSQDGTIKRLLRLHDGQLIETVLMPYRSGRRTACISTQAGCAMGCVFCATGQMGFARHLTADEIAEQVWRWQGELGARGERLSNVVFMGMGEPLHNYDATVAAARRLSGELGIGARHLTISTVGLVPAIDKLAAEGLQITLAISLHAANDADRGALLPVNRRYDVATLLAACRRYVAATGRRVSFEWALIAGCTDRPEQAHELGRLLAGLLCHVNLIPLNPTAGYDGGPTQLADADRFVEILGRHGVAATVRVRRGIDIDAGCGQLKSEVLRRARVAAAEEAAP